MSGPGFRNTVEHKPAEDEMKCQRCGHDGPEHEGNGGECRHVNYSEERIVHDNPADGVTIRQDWRQCECLYLLAPLT